MHRPTVPTSVISALDLHSVGSSSSFAGSGGDTDRVTLPSLCSTVHPEPNRHAAEYMSGLNAGVSRDKVSIWDSSSGSPHSASGHKEEGCASPGLGLGSGLLPMHASPEALRRRLHTPPEIRRQILLIQQAKRDRVEAERRKLEILGDGDRGPDDATGSAPGSAVPIGSRHDSRDGLKSRARSGAASREVARRIMLDRAKAEKDKEAARRERVLLHGGVGGMKHSYGSADKYLHSTSEEEKEARRRANEKRKQDKGSVAGLRKGAPPASQPKSAPHSSGGGGIKRDGLDDDDDASFFDAPDTADFDADPGADKDSRDDGAGTTGEEEEDEDESSVHSADGVSVGGASVATANTANTCATSDSARRKRQTRETAQETLQRLQRESDATLHQQRYAYFGPQAHAAMRQKFRTAKSDLSKYATDASLPPQLQSPRALYLREAEKRTLVPLSLTIRKRDHPRGVFLSGRGLGDARIMPIVAVIDSLPAVETIDLSDNRMTDASLIPFTVKLRSLPTLTHLDLSFNKIDQSSATIMDYIRDPACTLRALVLNGADVDDYEVGNLCDAMIENLSIEMLGLSRNLLGADEHRKLLEPGNPNPNPNSNPNPNPNISPPPQYSTYLPPFRPAASRGWPRPTDPQEPQTYLS